MIKKKDGFNSIFASLLCILGGVIVGFIVMLILALTSPKLTISNAFKGLGIILSGPFSSGTKAFVNFNLGNMIFYAEPLIMTGLSIAIAFKTGLFNIGAPGQFFMGLTGALLVALQVKATSAFSGVLIWILALVVAVLMGALWGCIPGLFKAIFGVNEVIVCIMTNWIAANIVSWVFSSESLSAIWNTGMGKTSYLITTEGLGTGTPKIGLDKLFPGAYIDFGIVLAILVAILMFIMLNKTVFGYELKACGSNKFAAKYAGMNEKRNIILSMAIAGGLAALGGALYYLNPGIEFKFSSAYMKLPDYGFNGIPVALLASCNPVGVIFAGLFIRYLGEGGNNLVSAGYNRYVADVIVAIIIYFSGFSKFFRDVLIRVQKKRAEKMQEKLSSEKSMEEQSK